MSAPYSVCVSYPSGHQRTIGAPSFGEAAALAELERLKPGLKMVSVYGDGYDVDCDDDGFFVLHDGLTDSEREALDARGLR
jgi:hypothetical protein